MLSLLFRVVVLNPPLKTSLQDPRLAFAFTSSSLLTLKIHKSCKHSLMPLTLGLAKAESQILHELKAFLCIEYEQCLSASSDSSLSVSVSSRLCWMYWFQRKKAILLIVSCLMRSALNNKFFTSLDYHA